jgi:uncharacterized protein (TIGR02231 family)
MTKKAKIIELNAPVKDVTLMEDRARVVRKGNLKLNAGMVRIQVAGVSPVISDKSVLGCITGSAEVVSTQIHREHREVTDLHEGDPTAIAEAISKKQAEANAVQGRIGRIDEQLEALNELERQALQEMGYDSSWNQADPELWSKQLGKIRKQVDALTGETKTLRVKVREIQKEIETLSIELATVTAVTQKFTYRVDALVEVKEEGDYELSFDYVVPSACWRPCHTAILKQTTAGDSLELHAEGCVWQNTGEDWNDVQLHFSTQRPSLGVEPPELEQDLLHAQKKPETLVVQTREQEVQDAGMGQSSSATNEMPGIDDGGEVLNLKSRGLATIPSDGLPYRVEMFTMTSKATASYLCTPELTLAVLLKSDQSNSSPHPLLAGPVDLIRTSGKVGNTALDFLAVNETFELGWGADPELRVQRWDSTGQAESKMLSSWEAKKHTIHVRISNIGADSRTIVLKERIPISEIEEVEIDFHADESTGDAKPDENGFLTWNVTIEPFGQHSCDFAYTIRKKKNVVGV